MKKLVRPHYSQQAACSLSYCDIEEHSLRLALEKKMQDSVQALSSNSRITKKWISKNQRKSTNRHKRETTSHIQGQTSENLMTETLTLRRVHGMMYFNSWKKITAILDHCTKQCYPSKSKE